MEKEAKDKAAAGRFGLLFARGRCLPPYVRAMQVFSPLWLPAGSFLVCWSVLPLLGFVQHEQVSIRRAEFCNYG